MTRIIKFFGWVMVITGALACLTIPLTIFAYPIIASVGLSALLGGALLITFARVVELLQNLNTMVAPISRVAVQLEARTKQQQRTS